MSSTANKTTGQEYAPLNDPALVEKFTHNQRQRAGKLVRQIIHKHRYGVSIMAQQLIKVNELQQELVDMGFPPVQLMEPQFDQAALLPEYAKLSAYQGD